MQAIHPCIQEDTGSDEGMSLERGSYLDTRTITRTIMGEDTRLFISNNSGGVRTAGGGVGARLYRGRRTQAGANILLKTGSVHLYSSVQVYREDRGGKVCV